MASPCFFQSLRLDREPVSIPVQNLHPVELPIGQDEKMSGELVQFHLSTQVYPRVVLLRQQIFKAPREASSWDRIVAGRGPGRSKRSVYE
jgi:hypothetical protein